MSRIFYGYEIVSEETHSVVADADEERMGRRFEADMIALRMDGIDPETYTAGTVQADDAEGAVDAIRRNKWLSFTQKC